MQTKSKSNSSLAAAWEFKRYEGRLTFADRKLDAKGRAERVAQRYFNRNVLLLAAVGIWSIVLMIPNDVGMRIAGMAMMLWVAYNAVGFVRTMSAMRVLVADGQGQQGTDQPVDPVESKSPLVEQAELDLKPYLSELNYAELQLMAEGSYPLLASRLYRRNLTSLLLGALAALLIGILTSPMHGLLLGAICISGYVRGGRALAVISRLLESESPRTC